jgi:hypothetical protein
VAISFAAHKGDCCTPRNDRSRQKDINFGNYYKTPRGSFGSLDYVCRLAYTLLSHADWEILGGIEGGEGHSPKETRRGAGHLPRSSPDRSSPATVQFVLKTILHLLHKGFQASLFVGFLQSVEDQSEQRCAGPFL